MCSARAVQEKQWQKRAILVPSKKTMAKMVHFGPCIFCFWVAGVVWGFADFAKEEKSCVGLANNPTQRQLLRFDAADESVLGGFLLAAGFGFVFGCGFALGAGGFAFCGFVFGRLGGFGLAAVAVVIVAWVGTAGIVAVGAFVAVCRYLYVGIFDEFEVDEFLEHIDAFDADGDGVAELVAFAIAASDDLIVVLVEHVVVALEASDGYHAFAFAAFDFGV